MKKFQRRKEDFICENCGMFVKGNGYTNHCPNCLWSKHVDINPGDRLSICKGMMKPVRVELEKGKYIIVQQCVKCGFEKRNKADKKDNLDAIIKVKAFKIYSGEKFGEERGKSINKMLILH